MLEMEKAQKGLQQEAFSQSPASQGPSSKATKWASFPGSPGVKTLLCQCQRRGFHPWSGSQDPTCYAQGQKMGKKKKKKEPVFRWVPIMRGVLSKSRPSYAWHHVDMLPQKLLFP